jgi:FkbM family methyltransferase
MDRLKTLLRPVIPSPLRRSLRRALYPAPNTPSPAPTEFERVTAALADVPRYTAGTVTLDGWTLHYVDAPAMLSSYEILVVKGLNDFAFPGDDPVVLDCGANIGLSVLRYKQLFPKAQITAFEPDPQISRALKQNLHANGAGDVEVIEAAVWTENDTLSFFSEGADGSRLIEQAGANGFAAAQQITVPTVRLADFLQDRQVDLLKIDIEGAETEVIADCVDHLGDVSGIIIEFHHLLDQPERLAQTLDDLARAGFQLSLNSYGAWIDFKTRPRSRPVATTADQYFVLYAWRPETEA